MVSAAATYLAVRIEPESLPKFWILLFGLLIERAKKQKKQVHRAGTGEASAANAHAADVFTAKGEFNYLLLFYIIYLDSFSCNQILTKIIFL